jgi:hypothetical protein
MLVRVPVLSHVEFDIIWEQLDLGERPYPFTIRSFGATFSERAELREQVLRDYDPRVEDLLTLLVRNDFTIDGVITAAGRELRILAAVRGDHALLAAQTTDQLRLEPLRGTNIVASVLGMLPEEPPGPGNAVTIPKELFGDAGRAYASGGYAGFERALNQGGVTGRNLRLLVTLVESERHGGGQLAASSVDRVGRRSRSSMLNWFDTGAGRYAVHTERPGWLTFSPGDPAWMQRRLTELVQQVNQ